MTAAPLSDLLSKRLILVTGKGGTGKSTLAAALALWAAKHGKRALIAESDPLSVLARVFDSPVGYEPTPVAPYVWACNIDFYSALKAYIVRTVKVRRVVEAALSNTVVRKFLDATPSAREMVTLMDLESLALTKLKSGEPRFDVIVVDLAASGHAVMLLQTPVAAIGLFGAGPVYERARTILDLLRDPARTALVLAALPEEMVVNETLETSEKMAALGVPLGPVLVNMVPEAAFDAAELPAVERLMAAAGAEYPAQRPLLDLTHDLQGRRSRARRYLDILRARTGTRGVFELPLFEAQSRGRPLDVVHGMVEALDQCH